MARRTGFGWTFLGTILCGFLFALPVVIGYLIYRSVQKRVEERKEKAKEKPSVV